MSASILLSQYVVPENLSVLLEVSTQLHVSPMAGAQHYHACHWFFPVDVLPVCCSCSGGGFLYYS